jgi:Ca2+:H+ antiporter
MDFTGLNQKDFSTGSDGNQFDGLDQSGQTGLLVISRGTAIILLIVYIAYLYFQLKSHADLFTPPEPEHDEEHPAEEPEESRMSVPAAGVS